MPRETVESLADLSRWSRATWTGLAALWLFLAAVSWLFANGWDAADYIAAALLLLGAGTAMQNAIRLTQHARRRVVAAAVIMLVTAVVWAEGAVGVF